MGGRSCFITSGAFGDTLLCSGSKVIDAYFWSVEHRRKDPKQLCCFSLLFCTGGAIKELGYRKVYLVMILLKVLSKLNSVISNIFPLE